MAELAEREKINQDLREQVHQQLDIANGLVNEFQGSDAKKKFLNDQLSKYDNLVSDRSRRLKSDTLRRLLDTIQTLLNKFGLNNEKVDTAVKISDSSVSSSTSVPETTTAIVSSTATANTATDPVVEPTVSSPVEVVPTPVPANVTVPAEETVVVPAVIVPPVKEPIAASSVVVEQNKVPAVTQSDLQQQPVGNVPTREIITEAAKLKQQPQIPWRVPSRLEPFKIPLKKNHEKKRKNRNVPETSMVQPLPQKEPERLALRYKTIARKRPAEESLSLESQFKKPFPIPIDSATQKPLFQRRHQLAPTPGPAPGPRTQTGPHSMQSRDPRSGEYRRMIQMQNRTRFESQNQQYFRQRQPDEHMPRPSASSHHFAVPAPILPSPTVAFHRPTAPKASVAPNVTRPRPPVAVSVPVVRPDPRKTNPVYSNDEPIRLGKKEPPKKLVSPSKPDVPAPEAKTKEDAQKKAVVEEKAVSESAKKEDKPVAETKNDAPKDTDDALMNKNLLDMLKELGDEEKIKQILDVIDDKPEKKKEEEEEDKPQRTKEKATEKKTGKKFKRIRAKMDDSSSEEEAPKQQTKKGKAKQAKRVTGGMREVSALIENSSDWMAKTSGDNHYTRRRGNSATQNSPTESVSPTKQEEQRTLSREGSDEEGQSSSSKADGEDSLLTVAKVVPAKGKQKAKESTFVYNDKKTVHCNGSYSSNCALCSFNGSAIVDHYVYDHKKYEVFVSRVSPKMADIIRSDLFMTNGTLLNEDSVEEKIRFKCYFCLAPKELRRAEWTDHLSAHTGEYRYRCTSCPVMSRTEELGSTFFHEKSCLKPTLAVYNNIEFEDNHLYGFICNACNYIQIRRVNMERHLKREHPSSDVTCSRFSIVNYKVETKPFIDEEQLMLADLAAASSSGPPTVMIPFQAKTEPLDTYEIVNQPFTEDEEMPDIEPSQQLPRRTDIRLESIHIGPVGMMPNQLGHRPFSFKLEQELQGEQISSSDGFYESPMSPEPALMEEEQQLSAEAQAVMPVLQIQSVQGGFDLSKVFFKQEKSDEGCESDASDTTTDLNMSDSTDEGRQSATDGSQQSSGNDAPTEKSTSETTPANGGSVAPGSSGTGTGGAAGAGGDGGGDDDRKKESFPIPLKIKVEKDDQAEEEEKKKRKLQSEVAAIEKVTVKIEKPDADPPAAEGEYDFVELVLDSTRIEHVAYFEQNSEALFLCMMPGCRYITKLSDDIGKHISRKHSQVMWDGYCHPCQSQISASDCSITNELQHLLDVHARRKTPPLEPVDVPPAAPATNVIRIRKMPGDTLSIGEPIPPPLLPILPTVTPPVVVSMANVANFTNATTIQGYPPPMIIQSASTISGVSAMGNNLFTPTHTIPAQIRPVMATAVPSTVVPGIASPPAITPSTGSTVLSTLSAMQIRAGGTVRLKPWTNMVTTKNQDHCRSMLEEISLLCLFKCMSRSCAFTTNKRLFMENHLELHDKLYLSSKPNTSRKCWLECAYCDLIAQNSGELLVHIDVEHANCGFQCNLCFYRSRDPTNVVVHQKDHHPTVESNKKILIMPDNLKSFGDDEWRAMQESLRKNVLPLHCTTTQ